MPNRWDEDGFALGAWCNNRRSEFRRGVLAPRQAAALEAFPGWEWCPQLARYATGLVMLESFVSRMGHARVQVEASEDGFPLGPWCANRRSEFHAGRLSAERVAQLESFPGWVWSLQSARYEAGLTALTSFVAREGHARVPVSHTEGDEKLGTWCSSRRAGYAKGQLDPERIAQLESFPGWVWRLRPDPAAQ